MYCILFSQLFNLSLVCEANTKLTNGHLNPGSPQQMLVSIPSSCLGIFVSRQYGKVALGDKSGLRLDVCFHLPHKVVVKASCG